MELQTWQAILEDGTRTITSYNHYSLGSVQDFIVREIAGLKKSVTEKATYIIEPDFNSPFEYCNLSYETPYGEIKIQWNKKLENKKVKLNVPMGVKVKVNLLDNISKELGSGELEIYICRIIRNIYLNRLYIRETYNLFRFSYQSYVNVSDIIELTGR